MIIFHKANDITNYLSLAKNKNKSIGFVPTMGALHNGHMSLIKNAKTNVDIVVCSIFINPTQFNDPGDFEKYPKTIEQDVYQLEKAGCAVLFLPAVNEMYPNGLKNEIYFELGYIETILDGKYRIGHFQGVCQVVHKLLQIILPDKLFLGQKDFQQCMVLRKMSEQFYPALQIVICPTLREESGLAMSSRNARLNSEQRNDGAKIYATLQSIKHSIKPGNLDDLKRNAIKYLTSQGFKIDYIEIANTTTLQLLHNWNGKDEVVILIAAFFNDVRLIDNLL